MSGITLPFRDLRTPSSQMHLINERGEDVTESILLRITEHCPDLLEISLFADVFSTTTGDGNNPTDMAKKFGIPYLGRIPIDVNMMRCCEDGVSFLDKCPQSVASTPFSAFVDQIVNATTQSDGEAS